MYIELEDHADINEITYRLSKIFGIKSISPVLKVEKTIEAMSAAAIKFAQQFEENSTFKIDVKRADKNFPMDTYELQRELGGAVLKHFDNISVNVKRPAS